LPSRAWSRLSREHKATEFLRQHGVCVNEETSPRALPYVREQAWAYNEFSRVFACDSRSLEIQEINNSGAEEGILSDPFLASLGETCTCAIIACVYEGYKRIRTSGRVSIVSPIRHNFEKNGISGISRNVSRRDLSPPRQRRRILISRTDWQPTSHKKKCSPFSRMSTLSSAF